MSQPDSQIIVVGGRQRKAALGLDEWHAYEKAVILSIDPLTDRVETVVEYDSPAEVCADAKPSIVFKAGDLNSKRNRLLVCTQTEVIEYDLENWKETFYFSNLSFNDLHHVCFLGDDQILIANTGLDQVVRLQIDRGQPSQSRILQTWSVGKTETWIRFDQEVDYRKVDTTKPHESHPNFVFSFQDKSYVTRFHQQDAIGLENPEICFQIACGNPHDGIVLGSTVSFTTTNGKLATFESPGERPSRVIDFNLIDLTENSLGWCRGLAFESPELAWIGFSRIRPTWLRKNLSWVKQGFRTKGEYGARPTRIAKYDLKNHRSVKEIELEKHGLNAVFGIYLQKAGQD